LRSHKISSPTIDLPQVVPTLVLVRLIHPGPYELGIISSIITLSFVATLSIDIRDGKQRLLAFKSIMIALVAEVRYVNTGSNKPIYDTLLDFPKVSLIGLMSEIS
jgi:hypothetical protein